jgi:hypothetical protein
MAGKPQRDWATLRLEFATGNATLRDFARNHNIAERSVQWHAAGEHWQLERERHRVAVADELRNRTLQQTVAAKMPTLPEINAEYIAHNREQCTLLEKCVDKLNARDKLDLVAIGRAVAIRAELFRNCRTAVGADTFVPETPKSRYDNMSDEELMAELREVRARNDDILN